jgi:hypothetical protein
MIKMKKKKILLSYQDLNLNPINQIKLKKICFKWFQPKF